MGRRLKIGDVFSIIIDYRCKYYAQYVATDQLCESMPVIRIFKEAYPLDYIFKYTEVFKGGIAFYVHSGIQLEIDLGIFKFVGSAPLIDYNPVEIMFVEGTVRDFTEDSNLRVDSFKWKLWNLNGYIDYLDILPTHLIDKVELCTSLVTGSISERIIRGYYTMTIPQYDILKRKPHNFFHSYLKKYELLGSRRHYWHFKGELLIHEIILGKDNDVIYFKNYAPDCGHYSSGIKFWEINWEERDFISEGEFEEVWHRFNKNYI